MAGGDTNNETCFLAFSSAVEKCGRGGGGGRDKEGRIAIAEATGYESPRDCSFELSELKLVARGQKRTRHLLQRASNVPLAVREDDTAVTNEHLCMCG